MRVMLVQTLYVLTILCTFAAPPPPVHTQVLLRRAQGAVERLQAVTGATSRYRSAAATRGSTSKWGIECVVANAHGVLHARTQRRHTQLA